MGAKELGITLAERCARYAKACGKRSILETMPVKNINVSEIGVCLSDGTIHFQNEESAVKYIFNSLKKSAKEGFEKVIVKKKNTIIGEANGEQFNANEAFLSIKGIRERLSGNVSRDVEVFHSHPDTYGQNCTMPLSDPDINTILTFNLKKMVAVNSKGEFNSLEITSEFNPLKFMQFQGDNVTALRNECFKELTEKCYKLAEEVASYKLKGEKVPEELYKLRDKLLDDLAKITKAEDLAEKARVMHKSYSKAEQYGLKYETNFSNLLKYDA